MTIEQYDRILLKNGIEGTVVEAFENKVFLLDIGDSPENWNTIDISIEDIDSILPV